MLDTPHIMINLEQLQENIAEMAAFAVARGIKLRPHIKAHKIPEIARMQIAAGATGITVAKLGEAEVMFCAGINDILVAYPLIGREKMCRARELLQRGCKLTLMVDSKLGAQSIDELNYPGGIDVLVKVDSGLRRCGFLPGEDLDDFVFWLTTLKSLNFKGLLTHAGHVYGCSGSESVQTVGRQEGELMVASAKNLRDKGVAVQEVSIGSTPTVRWGGAVPGVTEIRPGNYVFNDATQVALGVARPEQCSLRVRSTVISRPTWDRAIIDAGAKVLALDQGAHGGGAVRGFGLFEGKDWTLTRLSEEHGVLEGKKLPDIGKVIDIIPNHACPVLNLADVVHLNNGVSWKVAARGKVC